MDEVADGAARTISRRHLARTPQLTSLQVAVSTFLDPNGIDATPVPVLVENGAFDGAATDHCLAILTWLNLWGCRIQYPREGEPDRFSAALAQWWANHGSRLPQPTLHLSELEDADIDRVSLCFAALAALSVGRTERPRRLGSTAASKTLYALRPQSCMPWDDAIARHLHGDRGDTAYAAHLRLGRRWARNLIRKSGLDEAALSEALGCPGRPLAKIFDDYCYLRFTRGQSLRKIVR